MGKRVIPTPTSEAIELATSGTVLAVPHADEPRAKRLLRHWLEGRNAATIAGYRGDMADLAEFMRDTAGRPLVAPMASRTPEQAASAAEVAIAALIGLGNAKGAGEANAYVLSYRVDLIRRELAPRTINRRMAAIRSMLKLARLLGFISWTVEVESVRVASVKDTRGPGKPVVISMMRELVDRARTGEVLAIRNLAVLHLLYDLGLRRGEISSLDVEHWESGRRRLMVHGKKRAEREPIDDVPEATARALNAWILVHVSKTGPLFISLDARTRGHRLTGWSIWDTMIGLSGGQARPHGVRHTAITEVLGHGDMRAARMFSRHARLDTLQVYDDNRTNLGGHLAAKIAADMPDLEDGWVPPTEAETAETVTDPIEDQCARVNKLGLRCKRRPHPSGPHTFSLEAVLAQDALSSSSTEKK